MLEFHEILVGSVWCSTQNPKFQVIVVDVAPRLVGGGGWVTYRPLNDPNYRVMEEDSWKFQLAYKHER